MAMVDTLVADRQAGRHAAFFTGIQADWKARVQEYLDSEGDPAVNVPWAEIEHRSDTFRNLYKSPRPGNGQTDILDTLRKHGLTACPACGDGGVPGTLDHYLPQESHPHFAVLPQNLAPMCGTCQLKKLAKTHNEGEAKFFLHPYFDVVADQQVVKLTIVPPFKAPSHALSVIEAAAGPMAGVVTSHLRELGIHARFAEYFTTEYRRLLRSCSDMRHYDDDVSNTLASFRRNAAHRGLNCWDHVFYEGVASNPDLMIYLTSADLPTYL
ncbi:MAG: hypothetical protein SWI22_01520 [Pseudomonadota bacterium]|nr:hypothetical protein [Pseudomonadota bacterium]